MAINRSVGQQGSFKGSHQASVADAQLARVAGDGCARHLHLNGLLETQGLNSGRDLADAVHLLCGLHGRYPGLIQIALDRCPSAEGRSWLDGFLARSGPGARDEEIPPSLRADALFSLTMTTSSSPPTATNYPTFPC